MARGEDATQLLLRVLDCSVPAANISWVGKDPLIVDKGHQALRKRRAPNFRIMVNTEVWEGCEDDFTCTHKMVKTRDADAVRKVVETYL